jgi:hypothetical protein
MKSFFLSPRRKFGKMLVKRKWMHSGWFCPQRFITNRVNFRFQDLHEAEFFESICLSINLFLFLRNQCNNTAIRLYQLPASSLKMFTALSIYFIQLYSFGFFLHFDHFSSDFSHRTAANCTLLLKLVHSDRKKWNAFFICVKDKIIIIMLSLKC